VVAGCMSSLGRVHLEALDFGALREQLEQDMKRELLPINVGRM
jgi:hypothetical protein